jgi:hypothetical protein
VSEGEGAYPRWVMAHPACARRRLRAARVFISPKAAGAPIYSYWVAGEAKQRCGMKLMEMFLRSSLPYTETWTLREELICHPTIYRLRDSERGSSGLHSPGLFSHRQQ